MSRLGRLLLACRLGWDDLRHERVGSACHVLALAAIVSPLLILYGLKAGIIENLFEDLASDVRTLQVAIVSDETFTAEWIEETRAQDAVGFVQGHTRTLSTSVEILRETQEDGMRIERGSLLGSGAGDPLVPPEAIAPGPEEAVLSTPLAAQLGAQPGDEIKLALTRTFEGARQSRLLPLRVSGVVDVAQWSARGALVHLSTLVDVERWRDGAAVPERGWSEGRVDDGRRTEFPNIRLYAADLSSVDPLVHRLQEQGMDVRSRLAEVQAIQGLDRSLTWIFLIISAVAAVGAAISFGATLWANIERKTAAIGQIRLHGIEYWAMVGFPVAQAIIISVAGVAFATILAETGCAVIDRNFGADIGVGAGVCALGADHVAVAAAGAVALSIFASIAAASVVARVEAGEGLGDA